MDGTSHEIEIPAPVPAASAQQRRLTFGPSSPFDPQEREVIIDVVAQMGHAGNANAPDLIERVRAEIARLDELGAVLAGYPSLFSEQALGSRTRDLDSLVDLLSHSSIHTFEMVLPTRALLGRFLVMAEVNFYRLLRYMCDESLPPERAMPLKGRVDHRLCTCLYTKLAEEVLSSIAGSPKLSRGVRQNAVLALSQVWEHRLTYRVRDFFPLLEATWQARQRVSVTLGTLMGASEMFELLRAGCDPRFVDYFARDKVGDDEVAAFREFLLGMSTERLRRIEERMSAAGKSTANQLGQSGIFQVPDFMSSQGDSGIVLYTFYRSRHLEAAARRQAKVRGPKRTAEEYVMIYYLEHLPEASNNSG